MPDLFDDLGPLSFDGLQIPAEGYSIDGGQRTRKHTYPKKNGGKPEKLGRDLYTVRVQLLFDVNLETRYPNLWPGRLRDLIDKCERGVTGDLYLPTRGTLRCFPERWSQQMTARLRSGERAEVSFLEDDEDGFALGAIAVLNPKDMRARRLELAELRALYEAEFTPKAKSLFDSIDSIANEISAFKDQTELAVQVFANKAERLVNMCAEVERDVSAFGDARSYPLLEALKNVWEAGAAIANDARGQGTPIQLFVVPATMALPQVSLAIYGDGTRGSDLLALNFFEDAFAIKAGTIVRYYADAV